MGPLHFLTDLVNRARASQLVETSGTFNGITVVCKCHVTGPKVRTSLHILGRRLTTDQVRRRLIETTR